ncbi:MAG: molecular chaperone DnaJ [Desulfuromonas sp.]|nr:MAG: molecular chaperone DnaJ [Desulfuromonas sp.]
MAYDDLLTALEIFDLNERATLDEIRKRHRKLVKEFHPDRGSDDQDKIRRINLAYEILREYCNNYRYSFTLEEYLQQNPEERIQRQFHDDPVWGGGNKKGGT